MKNIAFVFFSLTVLSCGANKVTMNLNNSGFMAEGYDVTEYFDNTAIEGKDAFVSIYNNAKYKFVSEENKNKFEANPERYQPQYGGYCAYAVGADNKKISINPESYEIRDGKLYLFYDTVFADTKKKWDEQGPEMLQKKADQNWKTLKEIDQ